MLKTPMSTYLHHYLQTQNHVRNSITQRIEFQIVMIQMLPKLTGSHRGKNLLIVKKTGPNLIPLKIVPIGRVDLNSKIKFAICHWSWELG